MKLERYVARQRTGINFAFAMIASVLSLMWIATLLDSAFHLGWRWDPQIIWLAPLMMVFATLMRLFFLAIFSFVASVLNGS